MRTALVTGGSAGLGRALATELAVRGWRLIIDGRRAGVLASAAESMRTTARGGFVDAVPGDITDAAHRRALARAVGTAGLDLLVHNASTLGATGLHPLSELSIEDLRGILETNVVAPVALTRLLLPALVRAEGVIVTVSSDAALERYETWGGYGASKAALDHVAGTLAAEHPALTAYAIDPGDMRTAMHQAAFPGEDIGDRPLPESVVGPLVDLLDARPPSGRYRLADVPDLVAPGAQVSA